MDCEDCDGTGRVSYCPTGECDGCEDEICTQCDGQGFLGEDDQEYEEVIL